MPATETVAFRMRLLPGHAVLHAQAVATSADALVDEARALRKEFGENFFVKIPVTRAGLRAIKTLDPEELPITATGVYSPMQAFVARLGFHLHRLEDDVLEASLDL